MEQVRRLIAKVAPTDSTVLILGETGTGKELVARAVHDQSLRAEMPFVPINCGALPENLIESELFGHRKGAFTGADEHRIGLFEVANGGTLFLDEIGELPKAMQAKLLRFLESGEIRRVGDNESFTCDVRVVCATNRDLDEMVADGDFREDLWFRINTFEIPLPPLRERIEDIPLLAAHLLARFRPASGRERRGLHARGDSSAVRAHLAGQRPRAGQRDRARHDPLRQRARSRRSTCRRSFDVTPASSRAAALRRHCSRPADAARARDAGHPSDARPPRRQQAQGRRRTRHQPQDALQQAQPVKRLAGAIGLAPALGATPRRASAGRPRAIAIFRRCWPFYGRFWPICGPKVLRRPCATISQELWTARRISAGRGRSLDVFTRRTRRPAFSFPYTEVPTNHFSI